MHIAFHLENIPILELISKFYPDVNIQSISKNFILYINEVVENLLKIKIEKQKTWLKLKEIM